VLSAAGGWAPEQKLEIVKQTNNAGGSVSFVAVGANETLSQPLNLKRPLDESNNLKVRLDARLLRTKFSRRLWTLSKQKSRLRARLY
jgi:hypothetical protein